MGKVTVRTEEERKLVRVTAKALKKANPKMSSAAAGEAMGLSNNTIKMYFDEVGEDWPWKRQPSLSTPCVTEKPKPSHKIPSAERTNLVNVYRSLGGFNKQLEFLS